MAMTIQDVARLAGVSTATVSRVLRDDRSNGFGASPETRQRILDAAAELSYRPNVAARAVARGRTGLIGVAIGQVSESFLERILAGIQVAASQLESAILLHTFGQIEHSDDKMVDALRARHYDGFIAAHCELPAAAFQEFEQQKTPVVLLSPEATPGYAAVHVNDEFGGRLAGEHLLSLGHERIAYLGYASVYSDARRRGLYAAMTPKGLKPFELTATDIEHLDLPAQAWLQGEILTATLLARHPDVTAIMCSDDFKAVGARSAIRKTGRRVPEDISIVGYDDLFWTAFTEPALTTVHQPKEMQGIRAMELLQELLNGAKPREIWLEPHLTVRVSTARTSTAEALGSN